MTLKYWLAALCVIDMSIGSVSAGAGGGVPREGDSHQGHEEVQRASESMARLQVGS